jgi:squalene-hopene/tetraprenyl-beta-curcumene cyclase
MATGRAKLRGLWAWVPDSRSAASGTTISLDRDARTQMNELTTSTLPSRPAPAPAAGEAAPAPPPAAPAVPGAALDSAIARATDALLDLQQPDGHWVFELEADCTIPAEYVLLQHYLGEGDRLSVEQKIAAYLKRTQRAEGGWPLVFDGAFDMSASVKAYFALKMIGEDEASEPMRRARAAILAHGGAARVNVFTRVLLALYGILRWRAVPVMPVEIMLLPRWFPFHLAKISYWARTVIVPLLVLQALKPRAQNPRGVRIDELFLEPPENVGRPGKAPHQKWSWFLLFEAIDAVLRVAEPFFPRKTRRRAIDKALAFVRERLNGEDGLGAIFPAMANSVMMFEVLGFPKDQEEVRVARAGIDKLLVVKPDEAYCQPCVSPVWDSVLACHALLEVGDGGGGGEGGDRHPGHPTTQVGRGDPAEVRAKRASKDGRPGGGEEDADGGEEIFARVMRGLRWLEPLQVLDVAGDWAVARPHVRPGGWAFQYANPHYVDLDDTAVVVMAMDRAARPFTSPSGEVDSRAPPANRVEGISARQIPPESPPFAHAIARAREWIVGLQCRDGGWAAFDAENSYHSLNNIPFADHGALLDPPTADLTGRCLSMLAQLGETPESSQAMRRGIAWLRGDQREDGSFYGRWGMNYVYGTWSVLCALNAAGIEPGSAMVRKAAQWLVAIQNKDGGWGEDASSYGLNYRGYEGAPSTASQTAWALLGLMAAGEVRHPAVARGVAYLARTQGEDRFWAEERYTATGFPRVFYLRYHGYRKFFPLWALARYRNLVRGDASAAFGM